MKNNNDFYSELENVLLKYSNKKNAEILNALKHSQKALELAINATPTGDLRNELCDANILVTQTLIDNKSYLKF